MHPDLGLSKTESSTCETNELGMISDENSRFQAAVEMIMSFEQMPVVNIKSDDRSGAEPPALVCAHCFKDQGLHLMALRLQSNEQACPNCNTISSHCLTENQLISLAHAFFVVGSIKAADYGGAPSVNFNRVQSTSLSASAPLSFDINLLEHTLGVGFFYYGPRLWMIGHIEPLTDLRNGATRQAVIDKIFDTYPTFEMKMGTEFYRVRKKPDNPGSYLEYDAPPDGYFGDGRLDDIDFPVLYASQDIEICVHECRFVAADELYVATLKPTRNLRLLDLTEIVEEDCTEFESIDHALMMVFLAGRHSYPISRAIARAAKIRNFDGIIYPSYFSMLRTGSRPFETAYGLSLRRVGRNVDYERAKIIGNIALFDRPLDGGSVEVYCINRLIIRQVAYAIGFGPAEL